MLSALVVAVLALAQVDGGELEAFEVPRVALVDGGALVQPAPVPTEEPHKLVDLMVHAVKDGQWTLAAGALLMISVWLTRLFAPRLDKRWLPVVSGIQAGGPALALALMRPDLSVGEVVTGAATIWLVANGLWAGAVQPVQRAVDARKQ